MKNQKIPILDDENIYQMIYGRTFEMFCGVFGTCLKFLHVRSHYVQTCATSNRYISQTRKVNEKPKNTHFRRWKYLSNEIW